MKSYNPQPSSPIRLVDTWATMLGIAAAAVFVGSTSVLFGLEIASPSASNAALYGEAALWSGLGHKD
ncbi:hypothetical protein [Pseudanabaena sp. FACHB-2040]|uniref:hypothetical protein n=1 Tax=Pseudanabaena sp. FACHB-2040 TaxID=2692859 RepID=UPI001682418D|nr:hypothetical protein [Pseudanabaena sp. FACHB-2040]MBD2258303.1 hypothetical protein [Pseudanabaena sp. FACHB-2040]